jgi:hypothetical protein
VGLALEVGMLADLLVNDEEGAEWFRESLASLNELLTKAGLPAHAEPTQTDVMSASTYGYSGLHYLRRCAAHLQYSGQIPQRLPADDPSSDPLLVRYGNAFVDENIDAEPGVFAKPSDRQFDHLIMHSDAEGFYIPQRFDRVLIAGDLTYGWVGSSYALAAECERLADALSLPRSLLTNGEDPAFDTAIANERGGGGGFLSGLFKPKAEDGAWAKHPVAAMLCAKLHTAASHSIRTGAALVFC